MKKAKCNVMDVGKNFKITDMREEILDIAKKLYHNHLTIETGTDLLLHITEKAMHINFKDLKKQKKERPTIKENFEGYSLEEAHKLYADCPELYRHIVRLDKYIDSLEDELNKLLISGLSHCGLTEIEYTERERLLELQRNHQRWFTQEEFDRLKELSNKMFKNAGLPHCG